MLGTLAAAKMSLTDWEISGPIPSPSINVTVYLPYDDKCISPSESKIGTIPYILSLGPLELGNLIGGI
jgi:hypothetical protein